MEQVGEEGAEGVKYWERGKKLSTCPCTAWSEPEYPSPSLTIPSCQQTSIKINSDMACSPLAMAYTEDELKYRKRMQWM